MARIKLPKKVAQFMSTQNTCKCRPAVRAFHDWMAKWNLSFQELRPAHIESFISCPLERSVTTETKADYRACVAKYLIWRHEQTPLRFDPHCFFGKQRFVLPPKAAQFVRFLEPTLKENTIGHYRGSLRRFHNWLDEHHLSLKQLERRHLCDWMAHLNDGVLSPKSRLEHILNVRVYLRWLYEQGIVKGYPDDLIRNSDLPKLPRYLPRPIPPAADRELQKRLSRSNNRYHKGLLLMRLTGLRIGELMSLKRDCIRRDHLGHQFLKVPLGKLNTERLVTLDDKTVVLIEKLQGNDEGSTKKTFLIETKNGKKTRYVHYRKPLQEAVKGLDTNGEMVTHRLRHTYATALLSGGMSLVSIMKLLGHNDCQMTLRYTAITQETVGKEYFAALSELEKKYERILSKSKHQKANPIQILADLIRLIQKKSADDSVNKHALINLARRLKRIKLDLERLSGNSPPSPK